MLKIILGVFISGAFTLGSQLAFSNDVFKSCPTTRFCKTEKCRVDLRSRYVATMNVFKQGADMDFPSVRFTCSETSGYYVCEGTGRRVGSGRERFEITLGAEIGCALKTSRNGTFWYEAAWGPSSQSCELRRNGNILNGDQNCQWEHPEDAAEFLQSKSDK